MLEPSNNPEPAVIRMTNVTVGSLHDPGVIVVENVHWTVQQGDYWVIAGLQGSGKSDFLMMTGGVMAPRGGQYWLFDEPMPIFDEARLHHRLRLGLVFDTARLFNQLTVWENIALPLRYHRNLSKADAADEVRRFVEALELAPWADSTPGAIGRNWQKRVGLARALTLQPEVLLIDNPLAGLDLLHLHWWLNFLGELSKGHSLLRGRPVTLVTTTADLRPWRNQARQFAVLRHQRLTVVGKRDQLENANPEILHELLPGRVGND